MLLHRYSNGITLEDEKVNLDQALMLLENQQDFTEEVENYIGFTSGNNEFAMLQFMRKDKQNWIIDIPTYSEGEFVEALESEIIYGKVLALVTNFFSSTSNLAKAMMKQNYDEVQEICRKRWGIVFQKATE